MAYLAWKQNVGEGNMTPVRAKELLRTFNYSTEIDKKGNLVINAGLSKFVLGFKENGPDSTYIGVAKMKMNPGAFIGFIVLLIIFIIPGVIFSSAINSQRKNVFTEAVKLINQNLASSPRSASSSTDKLEELSRMKEKGLISPEEYETKRKAMIDKM